MLPSGTTTTRRRLRTEHVLSPQSLSPADRGGSDYRQTPRHCFASSRRFSAVTSPQYRRTYVGVFGGASVTHAMSKLVLLVVVAIVGASSVTTRAQELRPPAVPLVTCDPYFSVWSFNDQLTDADTRHWTAKPHTLLSLVRIDGKPFRVMGAQPAGVAALEQTGLKVLPTRTIYSFAGGGVNLTLTFTTPMLPDDLDVLSRPITYVTWHAVSSDGKPHEVTAMFAAGADVAVNRPEQTVVAKRERF